MAQGRISRPTFTALAATAALGLIATSAVAQPAPMGGHHAARGTDSGYGAGQVSPTGGYRAAIPVDVPPARGGVPVPFGVAYNGGSVVGDAGVGWSVPFSYVAVSNDVARRRPTLYLADKPPQVRERVTLSMGGGGMVMLRASDGSYRAAVNAPTLRLRRVDDHWILRDGSGRIYRFERHEDLNDDNMWLLREINDSTGNNPVQLGYKVTDVTVGFRTHKELSLTDIAYNERPDSPNCFKHKIHLRYTGYDEREVLAYRADRGQMRVRKRIIDVIEVMARDNGCAAGFERLRSYVFHYVDDKDTQQPRLAKVNMAARGVYVESAEKEHLIPAESLVSVGRYEYGAVTQDGGGITFASAGRITNPANVEAVTRAYRERVAGATDYATQQLIHDMTGDGLPDFIYSTGDVPTVSSLNIAPGAMQSTANAPPAFGPSQSLIGSGVVLGQQRRRTNVATIPGNQMAQEETYSRLIDFNADGRTDILVSVPNGDWKVHVNTPDGAGGIAWKTATLDMAMVREKLAAAGVLKSAATRLPIERSKSGMDQELTRHYRSNGVQWSVHRVASLDRKVVTRFEWVLADMNGDGYPDLVANSDPIELRETFISSAQCDGQTGEPDLDPLQYIDWEIKCKAHNRVGLVSSGTNAWLVFYNRAGVVLSSDASPFAQPRELSSSQPVREWIADLPPTRPPWNPEEPARGTSTSRLTVGLFDVNGDGIADRVGSSGATLGTGVGFAGEVTFPKDVSFSANESSYDAHCGDAGPDDTVEPAPDGHYYTRRLSALVDVNGDGLPDFVTPSSIHLGTGAGWAPGVSAPVAQLLTLSRTDELCEQGPSSVSSVQQGMFDIDGDGRTDMLYAHDTYIDVYRVTNRAGELGAYDAGRLTRVANGYGGVTEIRYTSAKRDTKSTHRVPYSEIVVDQVQRRAADDSTVLEPVRFAYGDARMRYNAFAERWVFEGFGRRVALRGLPTGGQAGSLRLEGVATVQTMVNAGTGLSGHLLAGRRAKVHILDGAFSEDPYEILGLNFENGPLHHAGGTTSYALRESVVDTTSPSPDCTEYDPYWIDPVYFGDTIDRPCTKVGFSYADATMSWRGEKSPTSSTPDKHVRTQTQVSVDNYGRPMMIHHLNDWYVDGDDLCEDITYASGGDHLLGAVHTRRFRACDKTGSGGHIVAGVRYRYDNLPEGQVSLGRATHRIVERYNVTTGVKLDEYVASVTSYDDLGNVTQVTSENQTPLVQNGTLSEPPPMVTVTQTQQYTDFDPFGLVPRTQTVSATSGDTSVSHVDITTRVELDPHTLQARSATDANGTTWLTYRDNFGRPIRSTVQGAGQPTEYVLGTTEYHGFEAGASSLPWVRSVRFNADLTAGEFGEGDATTASQTVSTTYLDALGRVTTTQTSLGPDYGDAHIISGNVQYDGLGRVVFAPDPYVSTDTSDVRYGTSTVYRADGSVGCSIRGRGLQVVESSDETRARFATCTERIFENNRLITRVKGANELQSGSGQNGAYSQTVQTAAGWVLEKSRWHNGVVERSRHNYDRLGNLVALSRYEDPAAETGRVLWRGQYDSLGQRVRLVEPGISARTNLYDRWGNLYESRLGTGSSARRVVSQVDGLGRTVRSIEAEGTYVDLDSYTELHYDTASGDEDHIGAAHLIGRLSWTASKGRKTYFGYDGFGRRNSETRAEGSERFTTQFDYAVSGQLRAMSFQLPDNNYNPETVLYSYDSAMRMIGVAYDDGGGAADMLTVNQIDPYGRTLSQTYGNGVERSNTFREDDRKELRYTNLRGPSGWMIFRGIDRYDAHLRVLSKTDYNNVSGIEIATTRYRYDSLYRLVETQKEKLGNIVARKTFGYDGLGNLRQVLDHRANTTRTITPDTRDRDRVCKVETNDGLADPFAVTAVSPTPFRATRTLSFGFGGGIIQPPSCAYKYDSAGNATTTVDDERSRNLSYDARNRIRRMTSSGTQARYRYDALGDIARLDISGGGTDVDRTDRRFGAFIERRVVVESSGTRVEIKRTIPGPAGALAVRGPPGADNTIYLHGDGQANRAFTDATGTVVQKVDYDAYGGIVADSGQPNSATYVKYLWNGGDALKSFGITHLGARLYDPKTGRFLQRDPLLIPRSSSMAHPYAFAHSDPVNKMDPSGLDPLCDSSSNCGSEAGGAAIVLGFVAYGLSQVFGGFFDGPAIGPSEVIVVNDSRPSLDRAWSGFRFDEVVTHYSTVVRRDFNLQERIWLWKKYPRQARAYHNWQQRLAAAQSEYERRASVAEFLRYTNGALNFTWKVWLGSVAVGASGGLLGPRVAAFAKDVVLGGGGRVSLTANHATAGTTTVAGGAALSTARTGAYVEGAQGGAGLGKLAGRPIQVSEQGLAIVEQHLARFGTVPQNSAMVGRLGEALRSGRAVTGADASFYMHELAEATMMARGMSYETAHAAALAKYGVSPFSVYHPDVVRAFPQLFNSNWFKFWGIR